MKVIGITGGVGSGKTELLAYIRRHYSCEIYLADEVAHEVKQKGTECYHKLIELLGMDILAADGEIDRRVMAEKIFASESLLKQVNQLIHPAVRKYLTEKIEAARRDGKVALFFVEAALLIEAGYKSVVDEMWYIYASDQVRRSRLQSARGYSETKIRQIMENQMTEEQFRRECDFVIDNSGTLEESYRQINQKLEEFS